MNNAGMNSQKTSEAQPSTHSFASRFTYEQFLAFRDAWDFSTGYPDNALPARDESATSRKRREEITDLFERNLFEHLVAVRDQGGLRRIEDVDGRDLAWPLEWGHFAEGGAVRDPGDFVRPFMASIMPDFVSRLPGAKDTRQVRDLYNALVDQIDQGAIDIEYRLDADCTLTGVRPFMKMSEGWAISAYREPEFGPKSFPRTLIPIGPVPPVEMVEVRIPAPSGRIMVADWFRMANNVFTDAVFKRTSRAPINTEHGKVRETVNHAAQLGVLTIFSGNSSPEIIREGGHMVLGLFDEEHPAQRARNKDVLAKVITDLWWTTMVDVDVFKALVRQELGEEEGEAAAQAYLAEGSYTVVNVAPGELYAYLPSVRGYMREFECETEEVSLQHVDKMFAVLSSEPLAWRRWAEEQPAPISDRQR